MADRLLLNRRGLVAGGLALAAAPSFAHAQGAHPVVATTNGPVRGQIDVGVAVFKGLRYGADTGPRRFQPPVRPAAWTAPVEAYAYGAASPQGGNEANQSEDCLFLNVWTPGVDRERRPVMVYIHGGAYSSGSGSNPLYDGTRLAKRNDVVVVTLNHRLNLFGYAYLQRIAGAPFLDSGNAGQLDLHLALEWVRDNIANFGGDPGRVMVFGQSGGGAKIATMMATPSAAGLFHRAATMSGQQVTASGPWNATRRAEAFLDALGLPKERAAEAATLPVEDLLKASEATDPVLGFGGLYWGPVLDNRSLMRHPFYPDAPSQSAHIPMIIGNTHDETRAFLGGDPANFTLTWDDLPGEDDGAGVPHRRRARARHRRLSPDVSGLLSVGRLLRRDDGRPSLARRGDRGRGAGGVGSPGLRLSAGLEVAGRRRTARGHAHRRHSAGARQCQGDRQPGSGTAGATDGRPDVEGLRRPGPRRRSEPRGPADLDAL